MEHIARIIPIKRLPKGIDVFDYLIPQEILPKLQVGQLVCIPIKTQECYGIVLSIEKPENTSNTYATTLKSILAITIEIPLVSPTYLQVIQIMSKWYGVSLGTLAKTTLLPLQKRKLASVDLTPFHAQDPGKSHTSWTTYTNETEHATCLTPHTDGQTLVLVPEAHMIEKTISLFSQNQDAAPCIWHSDITQKEAFARWVSIRNGTAEIIVGTRAAILLPFYNLKKIIIDHSHHEQHKQTDQAPRFHVHDVALLLRSCLSLHIDFATFSPGLPHKQAKQILAKKPKLNQPTLIDIRSERSHRNYSVLSHAAENALLDCTTDMFFLLNRKGFARSLTCLNCGFTFRCPGCERPFIYHQTTNQLSCEYCKKKEAVGLTCPSCASSVVKLRGAGIELVEKTVRNLAINLPHKIYRIDSTTEDTFTDDEKTPRIIVGTQKALSHIRWKNTGLTVCVSLDQELIFPEYTAEERVWHTIKEIQYNMQPGASFLIQTMNPEHPLFVHLNDTEGFFTHIEKQRFALQYPPYTYLVRYFYGDRDEKKAQQEAEKAQQILENLLTNDLKCAIIDSCYPMHPKYFRGKYWYAILVKLPKKTWHKDIVAINNLLPRTWKIDPHPTTIFRP